MNILEAYDLCAFAAQTHERISAAASTLDGKPDAAEERTWLAAAKNLLERALAEAKPILSRARSLPEMRPVREESRAEVLGVWVDAVEKLHAGITFHAGPRTPLLPALFSHTKFPGLRKATYEAAEEYARELERRLKTSYVERMLATEEFAFARPIVEQAVAAFVSAKEALAGQEMSPAEIAASTQAMSELGARMEVVLLQAKSLAQAALAPLPGAFEAAGLSAKPKRRSMRAAEAEEKAAEEDAVAGVIEPVEAEAAEAAPEVEADAPAPPPQKRAKASEKAKPKKKSAKAEPRDAARS